jgi:hypothetical protein
MPVQRLPRLSAEDLRVGVRFLAALPRFLRSPFGLAEARATVKRRFELRASQFLARVDEAYHRPASPYRRLFDHAGCEASDVAVLVESDGIEGALRVLLRAGVYMAGDEFKGRRPVVRGSLRFTVDPTSLVNPRSVVHGLSESSGSRGVRTAVPIDLAFILDHAINTHIALEAHGGRDWVHAHYGVPGGTAVTNPLEFAKGGRPPARWFTPVDLMTPGLSPRYRLGSRAMRLGSLLAGVPLPGPTYSPLEAPLPIARWISSERLSGRIPHVWGFASSAVAVCQAAMGSGIDVSGARFTAGGEPTTAARRAVIEGAGAFVLPRMGTTETDILAFACAHPAAADDMHFFEDRHALIQARSDGDPIGLPQGAMLLTSLLDSAPVLLLNVCMGDQAVVSARSCGCALEGGGWSTHVHEVRSFEKLTAGGITLLDMDVVPVIEEVLPSRFGGSPTDYQLLERLDGPRARPEVVLLVSPSLGPLDATAVADTFLNAVGGGTGAERLMELLWRGGGVLRIVREAPRRTASGKVLHLFLQPKASID